MASLQWYPHFPDDFAKGTRTFSLEEKGAYHDLLDYQWEKGHIPSDYRLIARILGVTLAKANLLMRIIAPKFPVDPVDAGKLVNPRLEIERKGALNIASERTKAGKQGAIAKHRSGQEGASEGGNEMANATELPPENGAKGVANGQQLPHTDHSNTSTWEKKPPAGTRVIGATHVSAAWCRKDVFGGIMPPDDGIEELADKLNAIASSPDALEPIAKHCRLGEHDVPARFVMLAMHAWKRIRDGKDIGFDGKLTPRNMLGDIAEVQRVMRGELNPEANRKARAEARASSKPPEPPRVLPPPVATRTLTAAEQERREIMQAQRAARDAAARGEAP